LKLQTILNGKLKLLKTLAGSKHQQLEIESPMPMGVFDL
jgi:hypothetical protein